MKITLLSILAFLTFTISSCKKENVKPAPTGSSSTDSFLLLENGVPFLAKKIIIESAWTGHTKIDARSVPNEPHNKAYNMSLRNDLQPGEYSHNQVPGGTFTLSYYKPGQSFVINHGTIHILSNDTVAKKMDFTFEAELVDIMSNDNIQVTNGKSTVYY